eukprot:4002810-Prymnesium_polylepis.1
MATMRCTSHRVALAEPVFVARSSEGSSERSMFEVSPCRCSQPRENSVEPSSWAKSVAGVSAVRSQVICRRHVLSEGAACSRLTWTACGASWVAPR